MNGANKSDRHCQPELMLENVGDDRDIFLQLAEIFQRESVKIFGEMKAAASALDFEQLGRQSHSLKGTVGPLGADKLVEMLIQIEEECNRNQRVCDENAIAKIDNELAHVQMELQQFVDNF
ncbi:MAG TPA: Hpt domain-containing protein [Burkholderiaceae bacterium]|jgi:HPt (histidine-containing phosphotransfer) domain-containing protein|nr:Hpt domain-containing protein [Burkholderiaceae bacterium]